MVLVVLTKTILTASASVNNGSYQYALSCRWRKSRIWMVTKSLANDSGEILKLEI